MSDLHAAFAALNPPTLSRLDELLEYLQDNIKPASKYDHARDLLMAVVHPGFSASLHDAATRERASEPRTEPPPEAPPPPPQPEPAAPPEPEPEPEPEPPRPRDVSHETRNGPPTPRNGTPTPRNGTRTRR